MLYKSGTGIWRPRRRAVPLRGAFAWWDIPGQTCVAAYQPIGAASLAASYTNLANPGTYNLTANAAPTFDAATGWTFDGVNTGLSTGITVADGAGSYIALFSDGVATAYFGVVIGLYSIGTTSIRLQPLRNTENKRRYANGGTSPAITPEAASGVMAVAGTKGYLDGADEGFTLDAWSGTNTNVVGIGCQWDGALRVNSFSGKIQAVAIYSTTLTPDDVAALTTRMQSL